MVFFTKKTSSEVWLFPVTESLQKYNGVEIQQASPYIHGRNTLRVRLYTLFPQLVFQKNSRK